MTDAKHATRILHASSDAWDNDLRTVVRSGYGFRGVCSCGERSRVYATVRMARAWNREHQAEAVQHAEQKT